jgi:hypothetical protein
VFFCFEQVGKYFVWNGYGSTSSECSLSWCVCCSWYNFLSNFIFSCLWIFLFLIQQEFDVMSFCCSFKRTKNSNSCRVTSKSGLS